MDMPSDSIENYLEFKDEEPEDMAHKYIKDMTEKYGDYKKISIIENQASDVEIFNFFLVSILKRNNLD